MCITQENVKKITIKTQKLFFHINEERKKTKQRIFENQTMAIILGMSFIAITKEWIDFKGEFVDMNQYYLDVVTTICQEKFNIELSLTSENIASWM